MGYYTKQSGRESEDGGSVFLHNIGTYITQHTVL